MNRRNAVTLLGGTGFIGGRVADRLADAGADITTIQRGLTPAPLRGTALTADRHSGAQLRAALTMAAPGVLVDMVAYRARDAEVLLEALPGSIERLVLVSSGDVYWTYAAFLGLAAGAPPAGPLEEGASVRAVRHPYRAQASGPDDLLYHYDKLDVEDVLRGGDVPVTVLRLPMVYGPGDPQERVAGALARLESSGGELRIHPGEARWRCTRGYVEDVAAAIALAALDPRATGRTYNVGEADAPAEGEWLEAVAGAAGWRGEIVPDPAAAASRPARWEFPLVTDTRRIREELDFHEVVGRAEGLRRCVRDAARAPGATAAAPPGRPTSGG